MIDGPDGAEAVCGLYSANWGIPILSQDFGSREADDFRCPRTPRAWVTLFGTRQRGEGTISGRAWDARRLPDRGSAATLRPLRGRAVARPARTLLPPRRQGSWSHRPVPGRSQPPRVRRATRHRAVPGHLPGRPHRGPAGRRGLPRQATGHRRHRGLEALRGGREALGSRRRDPPPLRLPRLPRGLRGRGLVPLARQPGLGRCRTPQRPLRPGHGPAGRTQGPTCRG